MMQDWEQRKPSVVFECTDIEQTFREMVFGGVKFTEEPQQMPWGCFAIFLDTDGNWFGLREGRT